LSQFILELHKFVNPSCPNCCPQGDKEIIEKINDKYEKGQRRKQ